jgi:carbonic anhydrase
MYQIAYFPCFSITRFSCKNIEETDIEKLYLQYVNWNISGEEELVQELSLTSLLPNTKEFITYEGSLTQPPCQVGSS